MIKMPMALTRLQKEVEALKKNSHPPVDIAPRIHEELNRMVILAKLFYDVPTEQLEATAYEGLYMFNSQAQEGGKKRR